MHAARNKDRHKEWMLYWYTVYELGFLVFSSIVLSILYVDIWRIHMWRSPAKVYLACIFCGMIYAATSSLFKQRKWPPYALFGLLISVYYGYVVINHVSWWTVTGLSASSITVALALIGWVITRWVIKRSI